jgi:hypothetical protein
VFGDVEVHIEALEPRLRLDVDLREDHAAHRVVDVREREIGEEAPLADLFGRHAPELLPRHAALQTRRRADRNRLAARHLNFRIDAAREIVALFQQTACGGHHARLRRLIALHHHLKGLLDDRGERRLPVPGLRPILRAGARTAAERDEEGRDEDQAH